MKFVFVSKAIQIATLTTLLFNAPLGAAENVTDLTELVRSLYKTDRQAFLVEEMRLNEREGAAFWPIHREYRSEMEKLGDQLLNLVLEYRDVYPNVTDEQARVLLKEYARLEEDLASTRARYLKRAAKQISAAKALRWAQLENRMDLGLRLQLVSAIPLIPDSIPSKQ